jgi:predicted nuclease with TOPRIM domain
MTKEQWDAKETEHCQFWKDVKGVTVLPRPYPGSVLEWDGWTVGDWKHAMEVLRAERDDALARYTKAIGGKDVALGNATRLRDELVKRDERIESLRADATRYNHESNVAYGEYSRLRDEIRRLARSLETPVLNAAFDKQAAEYKVLYEAALAFLQAVEASGAENLGEYVRNTCNALNRVLDGNTP